MGMRSSLTRKPMFGCVFYLGATYTWLNEVVSYVHHSAHPWRAHAGPRFSTDWPCSVQLQCIVRVMNSHSSGIESIDRGRLVKAGVKFCHASSGHHTETFTLYSCDISVVTKFSRLQGSVHLGSFFPCPNTSCSLLSETACFVFWLLL